MIEMMPDQDVRDLTVTLIDAPLTALRRGLGLDRNGAISDRLLWSGDLLPAYVKLISRQAPAALGAAFDGSDALRFVAQNKTSTLEDSEIAKLHEAFNLWLARTLSITVPLDFQRGPFQRHVRAVFESASDVRVAA